MVGVVVGADHQIDPRTTEARRLEPPKELVLHSRPRACVAAIGEYVHLVAITPEGEEQRAAEPHVIHRHVDLHTESSIRQPIPERRFLNAA